MFILLFIRTYDSTSPHRTPVFSPLRLLAGISRDDSQEHYDDGDRKLTERVEKLTLEKGFTLKNNS